MNSSQDKTRVYYVCIDERDPVKVESEIYLEGGGFFWMNNRQYEVTDVFRNQIQVTPV